MHSGLYCPSKADRRADATNNKVQQTAYSCPFDGKHSQFVTSNFVDNDTLFLGCGLVVEIENLP